MKKTFAILAAFLFFPALAFADYPAAPPIWYPIIATQTAVGFVTRWYKPDPNNSICDSSHWDLAVAFATSTPASLSGGLFVGVGDSQVISETCQSNLYSTEAAYNGAFVNSNVNFVSSFRCPEGTFLENGFCVTTLQNTATTSDIKITPSISSGDIVIATIQLISLVVIVIYLLMAALAPIRTWIPRREQSR